MRGESFTPEHAVIKALQNDQREGGGPIMLRKNNRNYYHADEGHGSITGGSGSGKTTAFSLPLLRSLLETNESFVAIDPKGDLYWQTECYIPEFYETIVIDFQKPFRSTRWNPLSLCVFLLQTDDPEKKYIGRQKLSEIAQMFFPDVSATADPFWNLSSRDMFCAAVLYLVDHCRKEDITLKAVFQFINEGESNRCLKILMEEEPDGEWKELLASFVNSPNDTRNSMLSVFLQGIGRYTGNPLLNPIPDSDNELQLNKLDSEKLYAIYILIPDQGGDVFFDIAGILGSQLLNQFVTIADDSPSKRLVYRLNLLLEEFGSVGKAFQNIDRALSGLRSRNIRIFMVTQTHSQLLNLFGKYQTDTILSNCSLIISFRTSHLETLMQLSEQVGYRINERTGLRELLLAPTELGKLDIRQALVIQNGRIRYITRLPFYKDAYDWKNWQPPRKHSIPCYDIYQSKFSIRDRADKLKSNKIERMFNKVTLPDEDTIKRMEEEANRRIQVIENSNSKNHEKLLEEFEDTVEDDLKHSVYLQNIEGFESIVTRTIAQFLQKSYIEVMRNIKLEGLREFECNTFEDAELLADRINALDEGIHVFAEHELRDDDEPSNPKALDIDDLIRRIDEKIKACEEEEKRKEENDDNPF